jgi:hypothetical protein
LEKLSESDEKIDLIGCVNSGIQLTTEGSDVIEILKKFEEKGARIATCGTCLDYHGKRDKLLLGQIGTMDRTIEVMTTADKIIRP